MYFEPTPFTRFTSSSLSMTIAFEQFCWVTAPCSGTLMSDYDVYRVLHPRYSGGKLTLKNPLLH